MRGDGCMGFFTISFLLFLGVAIMEGEISTSSSEPTKKVVSPTSSENLSIARWDSRERQTHDYRMKTDSDYRYEVELNMRIGLDLEDSILETLKKLDYDRF